MKSEKRTDVQEYSLQELTSKLILQEKKINILEKELADLFTSNPYLAKKKPDKCPYTEEYILQNQHEIDWGEISSYSNSFSREFREKFARRLGLNPCTLSFYE